MANQEVFHLLLFLKTQEGKAMTEGVENYFRVFVDGGVDDALAEQEVFLGEEVQRRDLEALEI